MKDRVKTEMAETGCFRVFDKGSSTRHFRKASACKMPIHFESLAAGGISATRKEEGKMIKKLITAVLAGIFMLAGVGCAQTAKTTRAVQSIPVQVASYKTPDQIVSEAKASTNEISVEQLKKMLDENEDIIVLDVRDRDEFEKQFIPGAIHMSRGLVDLHLHELVPDKNATIVVY